MCAVFDWQVYSNTYKPNLHKMQMQKCSQLPGLISMWATAAARLVLSNKNGDKMHQHLISYPENIFPAGTAAKKGKQLLYVRNVHI